MGIVSQVIGSAATLDRRSVWLVSPLNVEPLMPRRLVKCLIVSVLLCAGCSTTPSGASPSEAARADLSGSLAAGLKRLEPLLGEWSADGTMGPPKPDGTRDRQVGSWSNRWIQGGRHMQMEFDVDLAGRRVGYTGIISYNAIRGRYESVWLGSSGYRFAETGNFDEVGALVLTSHQDRPDSSETALNVSTFRFHADGTVTVEDFATEPGSSTAVQTFFVKLNRRAPAAPAAGGSR